MERRDNMPWQTWEGPFQERRGNATVVAREPKGLASMIGLTSRFVLPYGKAG
jgi:hypothetical protein